MILSAKDVARFWSKVKIGMPEECWLWLAGKTKYGHGVFSVRHKWIGAHRVSFFIKNGYLPDIQEGKLVMHDCENPACQNPNHLLEGTVKENGNYPGCIAKLAARTGELSPMFGRRGTNSPRWGMKHSDEAKAKIAEMAIRRGGWHKGLRRTPQTRENISKVTRGEAHARSMLTDENVRNILRSTKRNIDLARQYNIDPSIISGIRRRVRWKHIQL